MTTDPTLLAGPHRHSHDCYWDHTGAAWHCPPRHERDSDQATAARNKEVARRWFTETVNGATDPAAVLDEIDRVVDPGFVDHDGPDPEHGHAALRTLLPKLLRALPDAALTVEHLISEGDLVAVRLRGHATHTGSVPGWPATGREVRWTENEILRMRAGRLVESWGEGTLDDALRRLDCPYLG